MLKTMLIPHSLLVFVLSLGIIACSETVDTSESNVFVEESVELIQRDGNAGKRGCFEFVFPLEIQFADSTTAEASDYEHLRELFKTWKEENPGLSGKPQLVFPIELITDDGEVVSVASREDLKTLKKECRRDGRGGKGEKCFNIVFPIEVLLPSQDVPVEVADRRELKRTIRAWKKENKDTEEKPSLVFPITVELEDGSQQQLDSAEDLHSLKESCSE